MKTQKSRFAENRETPKELRASVAGWLTQLSAGLALALLTAGCGGTAYREVQTPSVAPGNQVTGGTTSNNNNGGGTTLPPDDDSGDSGGDTSGNGNTLPVQSYSFSISGTGGAKPTYVTPQIKTDSLLKVKIVPGRAAKLTLPANSGFTYSNFTANYACVSYNITVLGDQVTTNTLAVSGMPNYLCPEAAGEQDIDFSYQLTPGHGPVTIKVSSPQYDFYCQYYYTYYMVMPGSNYYDYCPLKDVYRTHTVTGTLKVTVNGTITN